MAAVLITQVAILDNPSWYINPLQFEIVYECMHDLPHDLEWKITYVGSAEDDRYDQADPPKWDVIPQDDILGVTVILLTCAYNGAEFIRVGYYVNNEYADEALRDNPPAVVQMDRVSRSILEDKPRVTRFPIDWGVAISTPQISDQMQMGDDAGMLTDDPSPGTHAGMGMLPPVVHALDYSSMMV